VFRDVVNRIGKGIVAVNIIYLGALYETAAGLPRG